MAYLFTSESVSEGHPDKVADQISDAILDAMLAQDPNSRVACETLVTTGLVVVAGEITTKAYVEIPDVVRETIKKIGYNSDDYMFDAESCGVMVTLHSQSPDIAQGVNEGEGTDKEQGAGDQGMMFGYASKETPEYMPMALAYSHRLVKELAKIRKEESDLISYLRPDSKAQVTIEYGDDNKPRRVHTIVLSTQHDEFASEAEMLAKIEKDIKEILIPRVIPAELLDENTIYHINPTGKFVIGGPHGDAGLTGRKIIVDTYGGKGAHGGGAFSGKDSSKVDRSAAYASRHVAKNLVAAGVADEILVQVAYAIGVSRPVSLNVNTYGTAKVDLSDIQIAERVNKIFDMGPKAIVERFGLKNPIFSDSAAYGHMGREPYSKEVETLIVDVEETDSVRKEVRKKEKKSFEFFTWEKLDYVDKVKDAFGL
ncbi:methionine adenosyltransferase [Flexithrix dorotheae]|uniref:methionine adenosyltransferase n=1 Tax=Flexithrix dorotheae TaxID=70993 RepID=UPI00035DC7A6|nr:methionine adenosyltransferase [Flexithrix dorotheae]